MSTAIVVTDSLAKVWTVLLDIVYPPRCGGCDKRGTWLCEMCRSDIAVPMGAQQVERLDAVISGGVFRGPLRNAVHKLKYESDRPLAKPLAMLISAALAGDDRWVADDGEPPTIVPVPLHTSRKRARGYNQSELLANELSRITGWPLDKRLVRVKSTRPQVGLHADERNENVLDAFRWQTDEAPVRVMLVDDVCTTGATLSECAFALMSAGSEHIFAATAARAIGGAHADS